MKSLSGLLIALVLAALSTSCTQVSLPKSGQGRVIISAFGAQTPTKAHSLLRTVGSVKGESQGGAKDSLRTRTTGLSRNLSAANDIDGISYSVINRDTGLEYAKGSIDLYSLSTQLILPPGGNFRIIVDVDITANAPGTNVGVSAYGAQADFQVDDYYDTYVDLVVRPSKSLVFDAASVTPGTPATITAFNPTTGTRDENRNFFGGDVTVDPADKLFYGPDSDLFYFNKTANAVYRWPSISSAIKPSSNEVVSGADSFDALEGEDPADVTMQLYAVCSDPTTADTLWVVAKDITDPDNPDWYFFLIDLVNKTVSRSNSIKADLEFNLAGTITCVPTGIAVDSTYHDVYITFYSYDGAGVESAVMQYYQGSFYAQYPKSSTFLDKTSSIYTDVVWDQGRAWVTLSPNTGLPKLAANNGTANILQLDDYLELIPFAAGSKTYPTDGALPVVNTSVASLVLPMQFLGPVQGTTLYFRQQNFLGGPAVISALDLDSTDVLSY